MAAQYTRRQRISWSGWFSISSYRNSHRLDRTCWVLVTVLVLVSLLTVACDSSGRQIRSVTAPSASSAPAPTKSTVPPSPTLVVPQIHVVSRRDIPLLQQRAVSQIHPFGRYVAWSACGACTDGIPTTLYVYDLVRNKLRQVATDSSGSGNISWLGGTGLRGLAGHEPPRRVRRLCSLGRMESCLLRRRGTRSSCVSGRSGWSGRFVPIMSLSGRR